jgi:trans-L-3-hydroxyproline dehydratase
MLAKRRHARERLDDVRRTLMWEPRGHADMYGCVLTEPVTGDGDAGVLFLHNEGWSTMCGHGVIALITAGLPAGLLRPCQASGPAPDAPEGEGPVVRLDTPAGRVVARARLEGPITTAGATGARGTEAVPRVLSVTFRNVPSFVLVPDAAVDVPGVGRVRFDLAFGGAFYAYVDAEPLGLELTPRGVDRLVDVGRRIKTAVSEAFEIAHPDGDPDLGFLYGTIFTGPPLGDAQIRNVCVFADGEVDRSPTGTGVSGRAAIRHRRGEMSVGEELAVESVVGTVFRVRIAAETSVGGLGAVVPDVTGSAHLTGVHEFWIDPEDPLAGGFLLR